MSRFWHWTHAVVVLAMIHEMPEQTLPAIAGELKAADASDRQRAMAALSNFGSEARRVFESIKQATDAPDPFVQKMAERLLSRLEENSAEPNAGEASPQR